MTASNGAVASDVTIGRMRAIFPSQLELNRGSGLKEWNAAGCKLYPPFGKVTRRAFVSAMAAGPLLLDAESRDGWIDLFNGHSLEGWTPSEHKSSWTVTGGMLTANGARSHLFYSGPVHGADFKNFELEVELVTQPDCNSGVYFHTTYQDSGFPEKGFEVQVNNTAREDGGYLERKKTGSLYGLRNVYKQLMADEKPFRMVVAVRGKHVQIRLNGELVVDYVEPTPPVVPAGGEKYRFLGHGTFALQCHNEGSKAAYRSVRVRVLSENLPPYEGPAPVVDETYRKIIDIGRHNLPMVDFHVYLRRGLSLTEALRKSWKDGLQYGITVEASTLENDEAVDRWLAPMAHQPVFFALAAGHGKWMEKLSQSAVRKFDYVIADVQGASLDTVLTRLQKDPIDILSGLGPVAKERQSELLSALAKKNVAIELNTVRRTPGEALILQARDAGCKFAFGTANASAGELKRCEYGLQMVESCKLDWHHFFAPGAWWPKAVDRGWS